MNSDVCIITEGTFPYIMGGVSTWIAQLIESMPDLKFTVVNISASRGSQRDIRVTLPRNLVGIKDVFLFDWPSGRTGNLENIQDVFLFDYGKPMADRRTYGRRRLSKEMEEALLNLYRALGTGQPVKMCDLPLLTHGFASDGDFTEKMLSSYSAWLVIRRLYKEIGTTGLSFLDYFWSLRAQHLPVLNILAASLPKARLYHAACTGYAGLLGARAAYESGRPFILTEHGIYSRERRIELEKVNWLSASGESRFLQLKHSRNWFRERWIDLFQSLSFAAYENASKIITLFSGNAEIQINEGADPEKIEIIPNGIITDTFKNIPIQRKRQGEPLRIGFVGRVVSIKDIKTLLRAMSLLLDWNIPFQTSVIGPLDEEPEYVAECLDLLEKLNLQDNVFFVGPRHDMARVYAKHDVLLLTSVSESFPYVILEANCAGLPVVATDVGACREMLTGMGKDDIALGPSGRITAVGNPGETAAELARLARHPEIIYNYGQAGRERVLRYYDLNEIMRQYRSLYTTYMHSVTRPRHMPVDAAARKLSERAN